MSFYHADRRKNGQSSTCLNCRLNIALLGLPYFEGVVLREDTCAVGSPARAVDCYRPAQRERASTSLNAARTTAPIRNESTSPESGLCLHSVLPLCHPWKVAKPRISEDTGGFLE